MENENSPTLAYIEWETLDSEIEISNLKFEIGLYALPSNCKIRFLRDSHFNLQGVLTGIVDSQRQLQPDEEKVRDGYLPHETIYGISTDGQYIYKFYYCAIDSYSLSILSTTDIRLSFKADLIFEKVEKSATGEGAADVALHEWYLCEKISMFFPRSTIRKSEKKYQRIRAGIDLEKEFRTIPGSEMNNDYLFIQTTGFSCIISKVSRKFGPSWSFNLMIEYRMSLGKIPAEDEREALAELAGFIFGGELIKIGESVYDNDNNLHRQIYQSPRISDIITICQRNAMPPVDISTNRNRDKAETIICDAFPAYLENRKTLKLKSVLSKYWIAKHLPIGTNLPILSSAMDTLVEEILKNQPKVNHTYINYDEFNQVIEPEICSIKKKLAGNANLEKIINKIKGSSQMGTNEKLTLMFKILDLEIGAIEKAAIKSRNKMTHSSSTDESFEEAKDLIRLTRAYETLFNRTFLKLLKYSGQYTDYYNAGRQQRDLNQPIP